ARQLHDQPLQPDRALGRPSLRPLRPGPGRDPDLPGQVRGRLEGRGRVRRGAGPVAGPSRRGNRGRQHRRARALEARARLPARITPGSGAGSPPTLIPRTILEQRVGVRAVSDGGFASLITRDHLSVGVILISLAVALFWGAAHALSPGHGKSIVAAYLVGQRGTSRHAVVLGLVVTVTHTLGVFGLGLVTLLLSQFIVPDTL